MAGTSVTLDISTRFVGQNEEMYIVRPGEGFSLYNDFMRHRAIFLDFPDIRLDFAATPKKDALRQAVVRSMELREWHRRHQRGPEPSRDPSDYVDAAKGRRVGRYVGAVERLYYTLKPGTIVVVPGPGYFSDVLIGEIVGPPTTVTDVSLYPGETLPARRVRWIGKRPKARFKEVLRDRLQKPTPLMAIDRSVRHEVLEAAFDQFAIGETFSARLRTTAADFSTLDDYNIQSFLNYVSGVLAAVEEEKRPAKAMDMAAALEMLKAHRDLVPELTSNINSPGALRLFNKRMLPIAAALLLALATSGASISPATVDIKVVNSAVAGDDPCALVVQEHVMAAVRLMDLDTWHQVCVQARDAAKSTGLATSITVVNDVDTP
ncbi:hypothetical protein E4M02_02675 [Brevundimonas sp. S30B]|uniref:hypothetical protein n=1 Tax=unclassified Brevundimonas TaxID=2622653 RepID=UPI001071B9D8|nr:MULTISPECIES: hypothetical protein [unclassified Brevundimonas]QBX37206.1 hypothetical protein E4M01_05140 [Brevundimonas sp. MF30-B]TFW03999.1 hypothetical protein E4M02_02675 [Brevundimonas sp. S30B]